MVLESWFELIPVGRLEADEQLLQGDIIPNLKVPVPPQEDEIGTDTEPAPRRMSVFDAIVVTQSCDINDLWRERQNLIREDKQKHVGYASSALVARVIDVRKEKGSHWTDANFLERVRQGHPCLFMLGSNRTDFQAWDFAIVDFQMIYSIDIGCLFKSASSEEHRLRLRRPFREMFSQAYARQVMRIGLQENEQIPKFKTKDNAEKNFSRFQSMPSDEQAKFMDLISRRQIRD